jgi:hypothetical protein
MKEPLHRSASYVFASPVKWLFEIIDYWIYQRGFAVID